LFPSNLNNCRLVITLVCDFKGQKKMDKIISEFAKKFNEFSNSSAKNDFELSLKNFLKTALEKLDVVPRAEFEKQKDLLKKAQEKLNELEKKLEKLSS